MIRAILVDDEIRAINNLKNLLGRHCPQIEVIGTAQKIHNAEVLIRQEIPDVVFLDIEMPEGNGFDLLDRVKDIKLNIIFVTAYDQYAIDAFRANAVNYLLKPIDSDFLVSAVAQLKKYLGMGRSNLKEVLSSLEEISRVERVKVPTMNGFDLVPVNDILYFKSNGAYTLLILKTGNKFLLSRNIGYLENQLSERYFYRIHREFIINLNEVDKYSKGRGGNVVLSNGLSLPLAVRRKRKLLELLTIS